MALKRLAANQSINQHRQRFLDIEANPSRKLMPIEGYANEPLVSLEEAVKPLVGLVGDIETKAAQAKWKCDDPPADGLTKDESAAIILYSMQWSPTEKCLFYVLNKTLRDENRNKLKPWFRYLKLFLTALGRLPSSLDFVYRGVKQDLSQEYQKGKTVIWWSFSSCTRKMDVLEEDQFLGLSGSRTMFNIKCFSGKDIQRHSAFPAESETLLPAARQFEVVSCLSQGNGLYMVQLEERKPLVPLIELVQNVSLPNTPIQMPQNPLVRPNKLTATKSVLSMSRYPSRWQAKAETVAGGHGEGDGNNQIYYPHGFIVTEDQTLYIADCWNHRIVAWKVGDTSGRVLAGGNGAGDDYNQLDHPTDVIAHRESASLIICDRENQRVMRWSQRSSRHQGEIIISDINPWGLTMDNEGSLYVSDTVKHEVRLYDRSRGKQSIVVAGGNGKGANLSQLNEPSYLFIDAQHTLYISDTENHRVMKWMKGAREGIIVAGGNGEGENLTQLSHPCGIWVDECEHVYVVDEHNHRVMRWEKGAKQGTVIAGGNGDGSAADQLSYPHGLFLDHDDNLYVSDHLNHRIQRFSPIFER